MSIVVLLYDFELNESIVLDEDALLLLSLDVLQTVHEAILYPFILKLALQGDHVDCIEQLEKLNQHIPFV